MAAKENSAKTKILLATGTVIGSTMAAMASPAVQAMPVSSREKSREHSIGREQVLDAYGLPSETMGKLLNPKSIFQVKNILARTPRHAGDEDVRLIWEAACLSVEQRDDQCVAKAGQVKNIAKGNSQALMSIAQCYVRLENLPKAIELATVTINRDHSSVAYDLRASCYSAQKQHKAAAQDYERAARGNPHLSSVYFAKAAVAMLQANDPAQALALITRADLDGHANSPSVCMTKAMCLERLDRWSEALPLLTRAVTVLQSAVNKGKVQGDTGYRLCHMLAERAKCYDHLGKKAEAMVDRHTLEKLTSESDNELFGKPKSE